MLASRTPGSTFRQGTNPFSSAPVYTTCPFLVTPLPPTLKLLFMDRSLIKEQLTLVGMADNTDGVMLHGRPHCGRYEYAFGIFDSEPV